MVFRRLTEDSSADSTEEVKGTNATLAPPILPPKEATRAKPVSLAEIRANLARKRSMEAKRRQIEAFHESASSSESERTEKDGDVSPPTREGSDNPLIAVIRSGSDVSRSFRDSDYDSSQYSSTSPLSTESSASPSSQESQLQLHLQPPHARTVVRSAKQHAQKQVPSLPRSPVWASNIEYISNRPSCTQPVNVPISILSDAGWDVIPVNASPQQAGAEEGGRGGATSRILSTISISPEVSTEFDMVDITTPNTPSLIPSRMASKTLQQASKTIEETSRAIKQLEEEKRRHLSPMPPDQAELDQLLQRRANSEDTLLKLYDYFDGESPPMPPPKEGVDIGETTFIFDRPAQMKTFVESPVSMDRSESSRNVSLQDFSQSSSPPPRPLHPRATLQDFPQSPGRVPSALPETLVSPKKKAVHFATAPNLIVTPYDDVFPESNEASRQNKALPSRTLDRSDRYAYQSELSVIQTVRGDPYQDHQWSSSDSDVGAQRPRHSKLQTFKDMLWR